MTMLPSLSIFYPCFNEEGSVEAITHDALAIGRELTSNLEIIIIDDHSRDRTGVIADNLAAQHPQVRVIHHPTNLGYGAALRSGFTSATKEWIFYTDGDRQFDLNELKHIVPLLANYDIISAYRLDRQDPLLRKVNALSWNILVTQLFRLRLRDIDCAFKLYPARLFSEITIRSTGAFVDTEILAKAARLGYRIGQIGVVHYPRKSGKPTGANPKVILRAFRELGKLAPEIWRCERTPDER